VLAMYSSPTQRADTYLLRTKVTPSECSDIATRRGGYGSWGRGTRTGAKNFIGTVILVEMM